MDLKIDELIKQASTTEEVVETPELTKEAAEEAYMEKLAETVNTTEQAQTLVAVGESMFKFASENEIPALAAVGEDLMSIGQRMGACLVKTASGNMDVLAEAIEIQEDLNKVASVLVKLAEGAEDADFVADVNAVVDVANELNEEADVVAEVLDGQEKEAGVDVKAIGKKIADAFTSRKKMFTDQMADFKDLPLHKRLAAMSRSAEGRKALAAPAAVAAAATAGAAAGVAAVAKKKD